MRTFYFWKWNGSNKTEAIPIAVAVVHGTNTLAYICIYCGIHVVFTINWYTLKFIFDKVLMNQITEIFEVTFVPCDLRIDLFSSKAHDNRKNSPHIHQFACTHTYILVTFICLMRVLLWYRRMAPPYRSFVHWISNLESNNNENNKKNMLRDDLSKQNE